MVPGDAANDLDLIIPRLTPQTPVVDDPGAKFAHPGEPVAAAQTGVGYHRFRERGLQLKAEMQQKRENEATGYGAPTESGSRTHSRVAQPRRNGSAGAGEHDAPLRAAEGPQDAPDVPKPGIAGHRVNARRRRSCDP